MRDNKYKQVACYRLLLQTTQPQDRRIIMTNFVIAPCVSQRLLSVTEEAAWPGLSADFASALFQNTPIEPRYASLSKSNALTHSHFKKKENKRQEMGHVGLRSPRIERLRHNAAAVRTVNSGPRFPNRSPLTSIIPSGFFCFCLKSLCSDIFSLLALSSSDPPGRVRRCGTDTSKYDPQASLGAGSVLVHLQKNKYKRGTVYSHDVSDAITYLFTPQGTKSRFFPKMEVESTRLLLASYDRNIRLLRSRNRQILG